MREKSHNNFSRLGAAAAAVAIDGNKAKESEIDRANKRAAIKSRAVPCRAVRLAAAAVLVTGLTGAISNKATTGG